MCCAMRKTDEMVSTAVCGCQIDSPCRSHLDRQITKNARRKMIGGGDGRGRGRYDRHRGKIVTRQVAKDAKIPGAQNPTAAPDATSIRGDRVVVQRRAFAITFLAARIAPGFRVGSAYGMGRLPRRQGRSHEGVQGTGDPGRGSQRSVGAWPGGTDRMTRTSRQRSRRVHQVRRQERDQSNRRVECIACALPP